MADPSTYRPSPGEIPESPGVYKFRDERGRVIYVGKAKSLRQRLNSYFASLVDLHPRTQAMVTSAASVEWTVVATEVEALQLEYSWIKEYDPRFNVKYRDDKSYPWLAVTVDEEYPRLQVMRGAKRKGVRYFGPYAHAWAIRETLDLLVRVFPARTCSNGVFTRAGQVGRPCLLGYIDKCSAPCVGRVSAEEHRLIVEDVCDFLAGQTAPYIRRLEKDMQAAATNLEYERAARLRDDLGALKRAMEKNAVVLGDATDADVIALAEDELEAAVQVFHVRGGRVRGQRGMVVDKVEEVGTAGLVERFLEQFYLAGSAGGGAEVPREILVPTLPDDAALVTEILELARGSKVDLRVPQRGDKKALFETVARNAQHALALHKTKRASDLTTRGRAMQEIQDALGLREAPLRIECFDVSHVQGSDVVASMVVFEDGLPRKAEYRRFIVRGHGVREGNAQDDTAAMYEVIGRRFRRERSDERVESSGRNEPAAEGGRSPSELSGGERSDERVESSGRNEPAAEGGRSPSEPSESSELSDKGRRFAYRPNLVVVDGGPPQVAAAARALAELGIDDVALCGLAKRLEEVWLPVTSESGGEYPVILPRTSEGLYLLQRVRDEAHRFAIAFHRQKRSKSMTTSALEGVPGLGEHRRKVLLRHFGSLKRLKAARLEEITAVPGIGRATAEAVLAALAGSSPQPAASTDAPEQDSNDDSSNDDIVVDTATGEVLQ